MEPISEHKQFIFNNNIDTQCIESLYEDDLTYIEEVFRLTLQDLHSEVKNLLTHYQSNDISSIRRVVHKIKPSFGFVGMPGLQDYCQAFEKRCDEQPPLDVFKGEFEKWSTAIHTSITLLENELERLTLFNKSVS